MNSLNPNFSARRSRIKLVKVKYHKKTSYIASIKCPFFISMYALIAKAITKCTAPNTIESAKIVIKSFDESKTCVGNFIKSPKALP